MGISDADFQFAKQRFPSLVVARRAANGQIDRVTLDALGVIGAGNTATRVYKTLITFEGFPNTPPEAMIQDPPQNQIRHRNIHGISPALKLPLVCMGNYASVWNKMPVGQRNLLHFLLALHHVLMVEIG